MGQKNLQLNIIRMWFLFESFLHKLLYNTNISFVMRVKKKSFYLDRLLFFYIISCQKWRNLGGKYDIGNTVKRDTMEINKAQILKI